MAKNPRVSIVIPAYNEEKSIELALKRLQLQTFQDFEVIVVDNNSTDNTAAIAKKNHALVVKEKKKGVAAARQAGFMQANGDLIASTDADAQVPLNWLETITDAFDADPDLVGFGGIYKITTGTFFAKLAINNLMFPLYTIGRLFSKGWMLIGTNFAVRKDAFLRTGGFNTDLPQGEDIDIAEKLAKEGKVILRGDLVVHQSGRRFTKGLIFGLMSYGLYWPMKVLFKKQSKKDLEDFRE